MPVAKWKKLKKFFSNVSKKYKNNSEIIKKFKSILRKNYKLYFLRNIKLLL